MKSNFLKEVKNWKELEPGTKIKIPKKTGSYYLNSNGEKHYMHDSGFYTINEKKFNGLVVHGKEGFSFVYMGEEKPSSVVPNVYNRPHQILVNE